MKDMKFYTLEEIEDKYIGEKGTPKRDKYEADLHSFLIGEATNKPGNKEPDPRGIRQPDWGCKGHRFPD